MNEPHNYVVANMDKSLTKYSLGLHAKQTKGLAFCQIEYYL